MSCVAATHSSTGKLRETLVTLNVGKPLGGAPEIPRLGSCDSNVKSLQEAMTWHAALVWFRARCMQQQSGDRRVGGGELKSFLWEVYTKR